MSIMYKHISVLLNLLEPFIPSICIKIRNDMQYTEYDNDIEIKLPIKKPSIIIKQLDKIQIADRI